MAGKPKLLLTMGDPAGIGPEILLKALSRNSVRRQARFCIIGEESVFLKTREKHKLPVSWKPVSSLENAFSSEIGFFNIASSRARVPTPGCWSAQTGKISFRAVACAIDTCLAGAADAMVTAPICKAAWQKAGCNYPGHTELLAERTHCRDEVMLLAGGGLRVALVTIHEPLTRVPKLISVKKIVKTGSILAHALEKDFGLSAPRIAVLGLNPHAGENGHIGREEISIIAPAIRLLQKQKIQAQGPVPADTAFHEARAGAYDAILAMYHDQGLGPLKTVAFDQGVNITIGLPIVRTSVDHGTAFNIAGTGTANEQSCVEAIKSAIVIVRNRWM